jgi:hypothetical protein
VGPIVINEVGPTGVDFIEFLNIWTDAVDVSGWTVTDDSPQTAGHTFTFANGTMIQPGAYLTIQNGTGAGNFGFGLGGGGDSVILHDDGNVLIDTFTWATSPSGTWNRCPNGTGPFLDRATTPNAPNNCP